MKRRHIILYSFVLAFMLIAISLWLTMYNSTPNDTYKKYQQAPDVETQNETIEIENGTIQEKSDSVPLHTIMGWIYPGEPACTALAEAKKYQLDVLKPEYFVIRDGGEFEFMTSEQYVCNGYSSAMTKEVRAISEQQFVMVSSSYAPDMDTFLQTDSDSGIYTQQLVTFVLQEEFTGVEIDFEDYGNWTPEIYDRYKDFLRRLGTALHKENKKLMIDLPPVQDEIEEQWYVFRLRDFLDLPVDKVVIMGYDYQFDHGVGQPVSPLDWLSKVVLFSRTHLPTDKLVIGLPSYGYQGNLRTGQIQILTHEQAKNKSLYQTAERDPRSAEMIAINKEFILVYQDEKSIQEKIDTVTAAGIGAISIWHLGGNILPPF